MVKMTNKVTDQLQSLEELSTCLFTLD